MEAYYFLLFFRFSTSSSLDFSFLDIHQTAREIAMTSKIRKATNLVSLKSAIISPTKGASHQFHKMIWAKDSMSRFHPLQASIHPIQEGSRQVLEHPR